MITSELKQKILIGISDILKEEVVAQKKEIIDNYGRINGREWADLTENTKAIKEDLGAPEPDKPMYRFGTLYSSFEGNADQLSDEEAEITLSNDVPYIDEQDAARPIMEFTQEDLDELVERISPRLGAILQKQ